ncbi:LemA family protein [Aquimarina pacifica]|uniref:LemA family protein n=1 Tax=Aquimarina pacifica TaxID=1296415 RepID=UPI0004B69EFD|nr:LemA family protein [Aquimarina pacifica]
MLKFNVDKSFANIDVILKQRADEIPNLIEIIKQYKGYEQETLEKLTLIRTQYMRSTSPDEKVKLQNDMSKMLSNILVVSENYPDLKANTSFVALQQRVSQLEDHIADRREFFNESVNMYNIGITEFPNVLIAKPINYKQKNLLEISDQEKAYHGIKF